MESPPAKSQNYPCFGDASPKLFFFLIFILFGNESPKTPKKWCFQRCISEVKKIQNREYFGFPKTFLHIQFSLLHYFVIFSPKLLQTLSKTHSISIHFSSQN